MSSPRRTRPRLRPREWVVLALLIGAAFAGRAVVVDATTPKFRGKHLARLEADWARLAEWVAEPTPVRAATVPDPDLDLDPDSSDQPRPMDADTEALATLLRTWDEERGYDPPSVHLRGRALLALLRAHPNPNPLHPGVARLVQDHVSRPVEASLALQSLAPDDLARLAALGRRLQGGDRFESFGLGWFLLRQVLDHVESDPERRDERAAALAELPAPEPDELFLALCRHTWMEDARLLGAPEQASSTPSGSGTPHDVAPPTHHPCADLDFVHQAFRQASLNLLLAVEPLRDDPARWASVPHPKSMSEKALDRALWAQDPVGTARQFEAWADLHVQDRGPSWAELVERWDRLVGR